MRLVALNWNLFLGALLLFIAPAQFATAQHARPDGRPALIVSLAGVDRLSTDIAYLMKAAGTPHLGDLLTLYAMPYTEGLNTEKPAGLLITLNGSEPLGVAFIPVTDFQVVLRKIEEQIGRPQDMGGGLKKLSIPQDMYFKQQGDWAFISDQAANLASLPDDPSQFLEGLDKQYSIALRVNLGEIPETLRAKTVADISERFERDVLGSGSAPAAGQALLTRLQRHGFDKLVSFASDSDQLTLGWGSDSESGTTFLDLKVTPRPGTDLSKQLLRLTENKPVLVGFGQLDAAVSLQVNALVPPQDRDAYLVMLGQLRQQVLDGIDSHPQLPDEAARSTLKSALGSLLDVLQATLKQGKLDGGVAAVMGSDSLQLVAGSYVADGLAVQQACREMMEVAQRDARLRGVEFDTETHDGIELHRIRLPLPERAAEAKKLLGEDLEVVLGTGADRVYVAFGRDCVELLKRVEESSGPQDDRSVPAKLEIALAPILEVAHTLDENPVLAVLAGLLKESQDTDGVSFAIITNEQQLTCRLELEESVLRLLGRAATLGVVRNSGP